MKRQLIHIVLIAAFALTGCGGRTTQTPVDSQRADALAEAAVRVVSQTTKEAVITETQRTLDSLVTAAPDQIKPAVQTICEALVKANRRADAVEVVGMVFGYDFTDRPDIGDRMLTATLLPGKTAPAIDGLKPAQKQPSYTMVLFYDTSCGTCHRFVGTLKDNFKAMSEKGVRVVTVATDTHEKTYEMNTDRLPWKDNVCDFKGYSSPTMIRWGVAATPTIFLIGSDGKVVDQYMSPEDALKVIFS